MKPKRNWTNLNDFWRNVITLASGNMLATGMNLAALPVLARLYLPDDFGIFGVFVAVIAVMSSWSMADWNWRSCCRGMKPPPTG